MILFAPAWPTIIISAVAFAAFMIALWLSDAFGRQVDRWQQTRAVSVAAQAQRASAGMGLALLTFMIVLVGTDVALSFIFG